MPDPQRVENVIQGVRALQEPTLSIIRLSEPISTTQPTHRTSDVSASSALDNPSPASLEADLTHYKELFSKLRFSYLEQVTKEKFLRAIVGDPPSVVEPAENAHLESQLADIKAVLKAQKEHVADVVAALEARGRDLSGRYETIGLQTELLGTLPGQIAGMERTLEMLRQKEGGEGENVSERSEMNLPVAATVGLVEEKQARLREVDAQLKALRQAVPRQARALEMEERELGVLQGQRERAVRGAREAVERKKEGGAGDEAEMKGRWLRGVEGGLKGMLGVEA